MPKDDLYSQGQMLQSDGGATSSTIVIARGGLGHQNVEERLPDQEQQLVEEEVLLEDDERQQEALVKSSWYTRLERRFPLAGHCCVLAACVLQTGTAAAVKALKSVDPLQIMAIRSLAVTGLAATPALLATRTLRRKDSPTRLLECRIGGQLALRTFCFGSSVCLLYYSLRYMPLGDVRMIAASAPVFVAISSRIWLGEECGLFQVLVLALMMVGVVIVMQPPFIFDHLPFGANIAESEYEVKQDHFVVSLLVILAAILQGLGVTATRALKDLNVFTISFFSSLGGFFIGGAATFLLGVPSLPSRTEWATLALIAFTSFSGQCLMILSLKLDDAGALSLARKSEDILLAILIQVVFFDELPNGLTVVGAGVMLACIFASGGRKMVEAKTNSRWIRKLFCLRSTSHSKKMKSQKEEK